MRRVSRELRVPLRQRYRVFEPVITVEPGETILVETVNHMTPVVRGVQDLHAHGSPEYREREETGPIFVRGAHPGDTLAVHIQDIAVVGLPHAHGWGPLSDLYPQQPLLFPVLGERCHLPGRVSIPCTPMIGDIYTTPAEPRPASPDHGGNMDFTEVRPGNTLYLPVYHEGALLVFGDVHAAQGDAELYGEGAETAADVTVTLDISRRYHVARPMVETPDRLICLAWRETFFESIRVVIADMTALLAELHGLSHEDAYVLTCMAGSLRMGGALFKKETTERWLLAGISVPKDIRRED